MSSKRFIALKGFLFVAFFAFFINGLSAQTQVPVKFSVDMSYQVTQGVFNPATDQVLVRGSFNSWGDQTTMTREGSTTVYSITMQFNQNAFCEYKYFITSAGATNGGWENNLIFSDYGNRRLSAFLNPVVLPVVYYNNADIAMNLASTHFNFYCTTQDLGCLNDFSNKLEGSYARIVADLQANVTSKIDIYFFRDLASYHNASGYPESPDWASGSANGKALILMASPNNAGPAGYYGQQEVIVHEFAHCVVAWKALNGMTNWLNEGVATYMANQTADRAGIQSEYNRLGYIPTLSDLENSFVEMGGYGFSFTIADFIVKTQGMPKLAQFVEGFSYSTLGYADRSAFQTAWHNYLRLNYLNNPPAAITISSVTRSGDVWMINYTPHPEKDIDNNTVIYSFTVTGPGFNKTYTDNNHSGALPIAANEFSANTTYTVTGKSFDGLVYVDATNTKTFTTPNTPPPAITIGTVARTGDNWVVNYTPHADKDATNHVLTYTFTITATGFSKSFTDYNHSGAFAIAATEFRAHTTFTVSGKTFDGNTYTDATNSGTFTTPNTPPVQFSFVTPVNAQTIAYNAAHKLRIEWSPVAATDTDGDILTDKISIEGNGLNKIVTVSGATGFLLVDSTDFLPERTYTLKGERSDGIAIVQAGTIIFTTPKSTGIDDSGASFNLQCYPVPSHDFVMLEADFPNPVSLTITVYSLLGQVMYSSQHEVQGPLTRKLDISGYPSGIYYIRLGITPYCNLTEYRSMKIIRQ